MEKEQAKERLKELIKDFSDGQKYWDTKPEADIKHQFIEPLFEQVLGWDRKNVLMESRVLKGRADYILKNGNQELLVVEAKKTNVSLTEDEGRQAVSYAYHRKIKFAVLTNFKSLRVYHALSNIKNIDKNLLKIEGKYFRLDFNEFLDKFDVLWLLSQESFEKGEINKLLSAKDEKINKPIDKSILEDLLKIREWLSKELKSKKNYLSQEVIDEIVQNLIDRLIFIRSVEDRGLEPLYYLKSLEADVRQQGTKLQLFPYLLEKFKDFNNKYDSKLFEPNLLEKEGAFSDDVLRRVILALYSGVEGTQDKYMFDIIPGDLLGSIYEQYLGTILSGTEKRVKLEEGTGKRKKMGIYYTPSYIVDYIVKNTVGEYIKDKSIDEILEVKIVDPACGSGSFLVRAFQEVCDVIEEKLKKGEKGSKMLFKDYKDRLILGQKIDILLDCIHGVDLDEKAVELARLNLLLRLLENEGQETKKLILPHLEKNIKNGNSLIDDSKIAGDKAFNWNAQFPDVFREGGFDVVVGNPPYVRVQELSYKDIDYFKTRYKSAYKRVDIAILFFEKTLEILKKEGLVGFISSNQFLITEYGRMIRELLLKNYEIKKMVDFGDLPIFESALTYVSIFILRKGNRKDFVYLKINSMDEVKKLESIKGVNIEINSLTNDSWVLTKNEESIIINKLNLIQKLNKIGSANAGIITGLDDILMLDKSELNKNNFEKELILPLVRGTDPKRYEYVSPSKYVIYPYKVEEGKTKILSEKELKNFPIVYNYLIKHKSVLMKRKDSRKTFENRKDWFALVRFGRKEIFNQEKIVTPGEVKEHKFSLDNSKAGFSCARVFAITLENKKYNLRYILAILNSNLIKFYLRHIASLKQGGYYTFSSNTLGQIPIHLPSSSQEKKIIPLVEQILELQKKYHDEKVSGGEKERLEQQIENTDYEIDEEVYKLYGITEEEKKIIEESLK
jgi:predicted type IV restriction endonuclease